MKKWEIKTPSDKKQNLTDEEILNNLLENRGLVSNKDKKDFLNATIHDLKLENLGIDEKELQKALKRIKKAIESKEQIVVFGDYDVDGICGTAILWETLHAMGAVATPYIPHRMDEGYGLSVKGINNVSDAISSNGGKIGLIITVDNGIVAHDAVEYAKEKGIDVIITDHHVVDKKNPSAYAIVHTTQLCGTAVSYVVSRILQHGKLAIEKDLQEENKLELVLLATIADLVPLKDANRLFTKIGLERIRKTKRIGLLELCKEAAIQAADIETYHIGHIIAPRLNAMGRLEYAMDSLRLICTTNSKRAEDLAMKLGKTNKDRQVLTQETVMHARSSVLEKKEIKKLIFIIHESYQQGVIGLVAGRLVEEFYRPAIVLSRGETHSKASARSVHGFNLIEFIRGASDLLVDVGGHPMAAGFTVENSKVEFLKEKLEQLAEELLNEEQLIRTLKVDFVLPFSKIKRSFYNLIQQLSPFGMNNPEPVFATYGVRIDDKRLVGKEKNHVKLVLSQEGSAIDAIGFGLAEQAKELKVGDSVDIAYSIAEDTWSGRAKLQLKLKDIK